MGDSDNLGTNDVTLFGPFRLFVAERLPEKAGEPRQLGSRALDILITLVERAGQVVTRKELISRVWPDVITVEANLRVHVAGLPKALGDGRDGTGYVANIPGRGLLRGFEECRSTVDQSDGIESGQGQHSSQFGAPQPHRHQHDEGLHRERCRTDQAADRAVAARKARTCRGSRECRAVPYIGRSVLHDRKRDCRRLGLHRRLAHQRLSERHTGGWLVSGRSLAGS
jgi:DNA-binding winged helix-turn-helix (wHTH) protein